MATLSTSYEVESGVKTTLKSGITQSQTVGIIIRRALTITQGVILINRGASTQEWVSFGSTTVASGETTLGDVVRGLATSGNTFVGSAIRTFPHSSAESVELVDYHILLNLKANLDRPNTWTADQLFSSTTKLTFGSANNWIRFNGVSDIEFKSTAQAAITLSQLASLSGTNDKVKITSNDTTEGYIDTKVLAGAGLVKTIGNPAANETWTIDINLESSNPSLQIVGDQLGIKFKAGGGLASDSSGTYIDSSQISGLSASDIVATLTYGESITAKDAVIISGDGTVKKAGAAVNDFWPYIGVAKQTGALNDNKNVVLAGIPADINTLSASSGKLLDGQSQGASSTNGLTFTANWFGQTFTPAAGQTNVGRVIMNLTKVGAPSAPYTVEIRATSGGVPTGGPLGLSSLTAANMASGDNNFDFGSPVSVTPGTVYAIVFHDNFTATAGNCYAWNYAVTNPYAGGQFCSSITSGASWSGNAANDFRFKVQYRAVAGSDVFLSTGGGYSLSPSSYFKRMGRAISATKAMLFDGCPSIYVTYAANLVASSTVDTELKIGFTPRFAICYCVQNSGNAFGTIGFWHFGASGGLGYMGDWDINTTNAYGAYGQFAIGKMTANPAVGTASTLLEVINTSSESITIRRTVGSTALGNIDVYLAIFG